MSAGAAVIVRAAVMAIAFAVMPVHAQAPKSFPVGVPVTVEAFVCHDLEAAKSLLDKREASDLMELVMAGKCGQGRGVVTYTREVFRKGQWSVWELHANGKTFYEATDWKPYRPGMVES